jgi:hypothetical protein
VATAVAAPCAIPTYFEPVEIDARCRRWRSRPPTRPQPASARLTSSAHRCRSPVTLRGRPINPAGATTA